MSQPFLLLSFPLYLIFALTPPLVRDAGCPGVFFFSQFTKGAWGLFLLPFRLGSKLHCALCWSWIEGRKTGPFRFLEPRFRLLPSSMRRHRMSLFSLRRTFRVLCSSRSRTSPLQPGPPSRLGLWPFPVECTPQKRRFSSRPGANEQKREASLS